VYHFEIPVSAVRKFKVKSVLEVGTLVGYSAILIASNLPEEGKVVTIEIKPESAERAKENILKAGMADKIEVHVGNALNVIPHVKGRFDMVFIDATKDEYLEYLKLAEGKLKKNGVVRTMSRCLPVKCRITWATSGTQANTRARILTWGSMQWKSAQSCSDSALTFETRCWSSEPTD
jgi:tRNA A58 N-methylase Trm61